MTGHDHAALDLLYEALAQRLILAQLDDDDANAWRQVYSEFGGCPDCVSYVMAKMTAIAAEALEMSTECHADDCVVCAAQDHIVPPPGRTRAVAETTDELTHLLDFIHGRQP